MIDFHVHAGKVNLLREDIQALLTKRSLEPGEELRRLFSEPAALERYLKCHGVERAVVLAECGPGTNYSIDSALIAEFCGKSRFFVPFGNINPNYHDVKRELDRSVSLGIKGFKFYPADHVFDPYSSPMMRVYECCESMGLPVMFHTGTTAQRGTVHRFIQPEEFEGIIRSFPRLTVILAHAGKPFWFDNARKLALLYEHVYLDTALVDPVILVEQYGDLVDIQEKILFGSDWPVCGSYTALMDKFRAIRLSESVVQNILRNNARKILG